jgi:predicted glutamine amidotransferase
MLAVLSVKPFPIRKWLLDANPGLLGLSLRGKNAPHRDGLGYAFRDPQGRWHLFRFGPKALLEAEIPGPVDREATVLLAHARKSSPEFAGFRGGLYAHPFFYDGVFLCHNGTVRDIERLGLSHGTDSQRLLFWLSKRWKPRTPERLEDCFRELLGTISDFSALNLLLSDGENLYALCAFRANPEYFTLWFRTGTDFVAVASEPADEEGGWIPTENGELLGIHPDPKIKTRPTKTTPRMRSFQRSMAYFSTSTGTMHRNSKGSDPVLRKPWNSPGFTNTTDPASMGFAPSFSKTSPLPLRTITPCSYGCVWAGVCPPGATVKRPHGERGRSLFGADEDPLFHAHDFLAIGDIPQLHFLQPFNLRHASSLPPAGR